MKSSPESVATTRRNILVALLAGMQVDDTPEHGRVTLLLSFYQSSADEQQHLSRKHALLRPASLWERGGVDRFYLEECLGLYMSQGSNANLDPSQMTDMGRMIRRVLTLEDPEQASGNIAGLAARLENWGADRAAFLRKYAELSATAT